MDTGDRATGRMPRRWTDVAEDAAAWALAVLGMVTVLVAVLVGINTHSGTHSDAARETHAAAAQKTMVTATVVEAAPMLALEQPPSDVPVRWTGPDGLPRTGTATVAAGTRAGDGVPVWLDRAGAQVPAPRTSLDAVGTALVSGAAVLFAGFALCGAAWMFVRRLTAAANARRWAREWDAIGPLWTRLP